MPDKIPQSLITALKNNQVIPFVGAGVSLAVKKKKADGSSSEKSLFPSWKEYVKTLARTLRNEGKPNDGKLVENYVELSKPKYLEAMQHAFEELGRPVWFQKLSESFNKGEDEAAPDSLELPKLIWQLGSNIVFTTNIDKVLEWKSVKEPPVEIIDTQRVEQAELLQNSNPPATIFYLHGRVGDKENIVFTHNQYENFYKRGNNEAKLRSLQSFLTTKSLLFIGYSLDDIYFVEQMKYIHETFVGGTKQFFVLIKKSDAGKLKDYDFITEVYFENFGEPLLNRVKEMTTVIKKKK